MQYVIPGYVLVFGTLAIYAVVLTNRGRKLTKKVEPENRRFLD